jgi:hypothetical protein
VNVYDLSSLYKHTYDEYYTRGPDDSSLIYQVHQRQVKLQKNKVQTNIEKQIYQEFEEIKKKSTITDVIPEHQ